MNKVTWFSNTSRRIFTEVSTFLFLKMNGSMEKREMLPTFKDQTNQGTLKIRIQTSTCPWLESSDVFIYFPVFVHHLVFAVVIVEVLIFFKSSLTFSVVSCLCLMIKRFVCSGTKMFGERFIFVLLIQPVLNLIHCSNYL